MGLVVQCDQCPAVGEGVHYYAMVELPLANVNLATGAYVEAVEGVSLRSNENNIKDVVALCPACFKWLMGQARDRLKRPRKIEKDDDGGGSTPGSDGGTAAPESQESTPVVPAEPEKSKGWRDRR